MNDSILRARIIKQIQRLKAVPNHKFKCPDCNQEGCIPFGGVIGSLLFCNECPSASYCRKEVKHSIKCCLAGFTEIKSVKKPRKMKTATELKLIKYFSKKKQKAYKTLFGILTFKEASQWLKEKSNE